MATHAHVEVRCTSGPVRIVDPHSQLSALSTRAAVSVSESCPLAEAVEVMKAAAVSALLVGDGAGIVTERDLARALAAGCLSTDPVEAIATRHPLTVSGDTTVVAAAGVMLNEQVRHLVVQRDTGAVGVVSMRDLLAVLLQAVDPQLWLTSLRVGIETPSEVWLG